MEISLTALDGMNEAQNRLDKAANRIARVADPTDNVDLSTEMVALMQARDAFEANAKVATAGDEVQKGLIDLLA